MLELLLSYQGPPPHPKALTLSVATELAIALVGSRLDYCNSLFYRLGDLYIEKLQRVQNCLARVVTKSPRYTESKPLLDKLHWLPIKSRIAFKINVTTFKEILKEVFNQDASLSNFIEGMSSRSFDLFFERPIVQEIIQANVREIY